MCKVRSKQGEHAADSYTAARFAQSWNHLQAGSVYTEDQVVAWLSPLDKHNIKGKSVLELGCGNGSILFHLANYDPSLIVGIDLGDSVESAKLTMRQVKSVNWRIEKHDLVTFQSPGFDIAICIGVLHHLSDPKAGLDSVVANTKPGGSFHCWVYGYEGNKLVRLLVEPIRRAVKYLPWWVIKFGIALPLSIPFFIYSKLLKYFRSDLISALPLGAYCFSLVDREFLFFWHVALDQLISPSTVYISRDTIENWLHSYDKLEPTSIYIEMRNGNSWKFGATIKSDRAQTVSN